MTKHKRFAGVVSALLAVSTLATAVPAQAQEERGRWSRGEGTPRVERGGEGTGGPSRGQMPPRSPDRQIRSANPDRLGQRPVESLPQARVESRNEDSRRGGWDRDRNRDRDGDRPTWNRDRDRGEWERDRDRDRQVWNRDRDRQTWNRDRDWNDNRRWDRDDRRDWNGGRFDSRHRWNDQHRWDRDWRHDNRYDWQRYRTYNRGIYRMPRYYAPYGWNHGYRSFSIGVVLNSGLYSRNYWINDPGYYRLPPAYGYLRWVRYYDDALLVDVRDGYVVDVIRNFFW